MKHIFYFIGIFYILYEIFWIINPKDEALKSKKLLDTTKNNKDKKWDEYTENEKSTIYQQSPKLILYLWLLLGFFTFQWPVFLGLILLGLITSFITSKWRYTTYYLIVHWISSVIGFVAGMFIIVNAYHLKIDVWQFILNHFKF